jgi:glutaredoxin
LKVTVFSGSDCNKYDLAKRQLDKRAITDEEVSLAEHPELVAKFKAEGRTETLPIASTGPPVGFGSQ